MCAALLMSTRRTTRARSCVLLFFLYRIIVVVISLLEGVHYRSTHYDDTLPKDRQTYIHLPYLIFLA